VTPCYHLDANVVLRFLRNDDPRQSPASARLFANAKTGNIRLSICAVIIAEIFYVLSRVYKFSRADAAGKLIAFVHSDAIEVENRKRVIDSLQRVVKYNVDFGDSYLASTAAEHGDKVSSFDEDFRAFGDVTTEAPQ
jgi:predicted nucleic acid-binding protein